MKLKRKAETGMQYVLKQTLLRRNQLLRRARRTQQKEFKDELHKYRQGKLISDRWTRQAIKSERLARREDWLCGPLAPQRDIGELRDTYGTAGQEIIHPPELPERLRTTDEDSGLVSGDRVVIVRGLGLGKIGEISDVNHATGTVVVKGIRQADFALPDWAPGAQDREKKYTSADLPIPVKDVRLVYPLTDSETGYTRDVVVRHMHFGPPHVERSPFSNLPRHTRYVSLSDDESIPLPWPEEKLVDNYATEADTRRLTVENKTYIACPQLDRVVPDKSIIAELRDPYARDRASHELEFMKRKVLVDMKKTWERERQRRGGVAIGTPTSEYWAHEMERRQAERERRLQEGPDPETLRIIEEEMGRVRVGV